VSFEKNTKIGITSSAYEESTKYRKMGGNGVLFPEIRSAFPRL